ncbi:MAG: type I methionyl aminopeptidase [Alphaproteobacteria bacterium]|nr:type I methionyl aminopeptidase [Alphaproteobacteria bacterium]
MSRVKDPWEVQLMRQSGKRLAEVAAVLRESVTPGISTKDIDAIAEHEIRKRGGIPSFLGYTAGGPTPYPATICASPNDAVVHGIPNDTPLKEGDILSLDMGMIYGGYHSDHAFTVGVGNIPEEVQKLLEVTEASLWEGIRAAQPGNRIGDIGNAVERYVDPHGFGIVREYVGHGIGRAMHERPSVPNYGPANQGQLLKEGFCLAIEPMINLGGEETKVLRDGWTVVTKDGSLSAHFEHTITITNRGPEVLTVLDGGVIAPSP